MSCTSFAVPFQKHGGKRGEICMSAHWFSSCFCLVYTPRGKRLHIFSAIFLSLFLIYFTIFPICWQYPLRRRKFSHDLAHPALARARPVDNFLFYTPPPPPIRGKSDALHLLHQFRQLGAEAGDLGFVLMHDGVFKQRT